MQSKIYTPASLMMTLLLLLLLLLSSAVQLASSADQQTPAQEYADCQRGCTTEWNGCYRQLGEKAGEFGKKPSAGGLKCNSQQSDCMAECARKIKAKNEL